MSNVAKLKKQAAEFELKKQFDKALVVYVKLLESFDQYGSEIDVALFNRVGDLMLRQGNVADALDYYEQAVDRYVETGFFNNAIALCNKILRHSPGRASVYYKLGKIGAHKGFKNDAKQNFLEYADRMQKAGKKDEAFRALTEFADLCPDQDDIRLMLAEQLSKANRKDDALEQLQTLYARYQSEGRTAEAAAALDRMRAIDPQVQPRSGYSNAASATSDLIFIDLDDTPRPPPQPIRRVSGPVAPPPVTPPRAAPPLVAAPPAAQTPTAPTTAAVTPQDLPLLDMSEIEDEVVIPPPPELTRPPAVDVPPIPDFMAASIDVENAEVVNDVVHGAEFMSDGAVDTPTVPDLVADFADAGSSDVDVDPISDLETPMVAEAEVGVVEPLQDVERVVVDEADVAAVESLQDLDRDPEAEEMEVPATDLLLGLESSSIAGFAIEHTPTQALEGVESTTVPEVVDEVPSADLDFLVRDPELDPAMAAEAEPEGYLGEDLGARHSPLSSPRATPTPTPSETTPDEAPFLSRPDPVEAISFPLGATDADNLLASAEQAEEVDESADAFGDEAPEVGESDDAVSGQDTDEDAVELPTPSFARRATMVAVQSVEMLKARIEEEPQNWSRHRELAEAMLEAGDRAGGLRELATAMAGAERASDLDLASALADEIARLEPEVVRHHQKRVEYAFRMNDRSRLIDAYLSLGDALLRTGQADKAGTVYQRVLDLAPDDARALAAMETIAAVDATAPSPASPTTTRFAQTDAPRRRRTPLKSAQRVDGSVDASFIDLGQLLRADEPTKDLRMVVEEKEPTGDEAADFAEMLRKFKQGVAENVDAEDYQSHYDLAIAYKEMGLIDEAIAEFQKALAGPTNRLPTFEALGQCFIDKGQFKMASSILSRALTDRDATEEKLVGVLYLLGRVTEVQGRTDEALAYYQRVFVVDIEFRDIAERISELERAGR